MKKVYHTEEEKVEAYRKMRREAYKRWYDKTKADPEKWEAFRAKAKRKTKKGQLEARIRELEEAQTIGA